EVVTARRDCPRILYTFTGHQLSRELIRCELSTGANSCWRRPHPRVAHDGSHQRVSPAGVVELYDHFPLVNFHFWHLVVEERKRSKIRIDESMKGSSRTGHPPLCRTRVRMLARRCSNNCHSKVSRDDE